MLLYASRVSNDPRLKGGAARDKYEATTGGEEFHLTRLMTRIVVNGERPDSAPKSNLDARCTFTVITNSKAPPWNKDHRSPLLLELN